MPQRRFFPRLIALSVFDPRCFTTFMLVYQCPWLPYAKDLQTLRLFGWRFGTTGSSSIPRQTLHNHSPVLAPKLSERSCSLNLWCVEQIKESAKQSESMPVQERRRTHAASLLTREPAHGDFLLVHSSACFALLCQHGEKGQAFHRYGAGGGLQITA